MSDAISLTANMAYLDAAAMDVSPAMFTAIPAISLQPNQSLLLPDVSPSGFQPTDIARVETIGLTPGEYGEQVLNDSFVPSYSLADATAIVDSQESATPVDQDPDAWKDTSKVYTAEGTYTVREWESIQAERQAAAAAEPEKKTWLQRLGGFLGFGTLGGLLGTATSLSGAYRMVKDQIDPEQKKDGDGMAGNGYVLKRDPVTGRAIDPVTGYQIDPLTGYLIHPSTGQLIDRTGKVVQRTGISGSETGLAGLLNSIFGTPVVSGGSGSRGAGVTVNQPAAGGISPAMVGAGLLVLWLMMRRK